MPANKHELVRRLVERIPLLTEGQLHWLDRVTTIFEAKHDYDILTEGLISSESLAAFGDALRIHHCFSAEPFSKDKFEYVLQHVLLLCGHEAELAPKGNRGHDITIDGTRVSLKTQANRAIHKHKIWISKFMELGRGEWGDDAANLAGLRDAFLAHLRSYDRILVLRALEREPCWHYELVEIPKKVLSQAKGGELEMKSNSRQFPKPGYCRVSNREGEEIFQLYFDGGTERKLQIKSLSKSCCIVHATWSFAIPPE